MDVRRGWLWVLVLWLFHAAGTVWFLLVDDFPLPYESTAYFILSAHHYRDPSDLFRLEAPFPSLFMGLAVPFLSIFGLSPDAATLVNVPFFGLLLASVYGIGAHLGGVRCGIWAAALVSFFPSVYGLARVYSTELSLTAWISLGIWCLLESEGFRRLLWVVAGSVALSAACLTRAVTPVYLLVPVGMLLCSSWRMSSRTSPKRVLVHQVIAGAICLALVGSWYAWHLRDLVKFYTRDTPLFDYEHASISLFSAGTLFFYPDALWRVHLGPGLFLVFLWTVARLVCSWDRRMMFPLVSLVGAWGLLMLLAVKVERYFVPLLPAVGLLMAGALAQLPVGRVRVLSGIAVAGLAVGQFLFLHVGDPMDPSRFAGLPSLAARELMRYDRGAFRVCRGDWKGKEILRAIEQDRVGREIFELPVRVVLPKRMESFLTAEFRCEAAARGLPLVVEMPWHPVLLRQGNDRVDRESALEANRSAHYALVCTVADRRLDRRHAIAQGLQQMEEIWEEIKEDFEIMRQFELPYGFGLMLYRNREVLPSAGPASIDTTEGHD